MSLFAREDTNDKELREALMRMVEQIKAVGGQFTFDFKIDDQGWAARCREFDGIVTGGASKNPPEEEVMQSLIDAIKTAFHIPINRLEIKSAEAQELPMIKVVREREFQFA
ncbi:MAG: hypothetical protein A2940_01780 [Candidatus Wildermuthbacteria bacterium RIFCSPLOWO2_01_FULL_48_29]|uniref:Uncharacterized protein n=1 Tax=Candidatus Wildermuthbacteria bacterium RIFCSPLOWO2_01_FULL_48_29 TaxID=1802462 RepID=A0A1G2RLH2_9BACT|nr:MAG: hypothetical protein A2940_01780 [Candidatus Wildermuthbacteria bacterium RIFCSPLOWO2_01_FULL_48_29]